MSISTHKSFYDTRPFDAYFALPFTDLDEEEMRALELGEQRVQECIDLVKQANDDATGLDASDPVPASIEKLARLLDKIMKNELVKAELAKGDL